MKRQIARALDDSEESNSSESMDAIRQNLCNEIKRQRLRINSNQHLENHENTETEISEAESEINLQIVGQSYNQANIEQPDGEIPSTSSINHSIINNVDENETQFIPLQNKELRIQMLKGHDDDIWEVTRDENFILSASADTTVKVWNDEGNEICSLRGHTGSVSGTILLSTEDSEIFFNALDCNGERIVISGSKDCCLKIWTLTNGRQIKSIYVYNCINCLCHLEESQVIIGTDSGKIQIWDVLTATVQLSIQAYTEAVVQLQFNDQYIIGLSLNGSLKIWQYSNQQLQEINFIDQQIKGICFSIDKEKLYLASCDTNLHIINIKTKKTEVFKNFFNSNVQVNVLCTKQDNLIVAQYHCESNFGYIDVYQIPDCEYSCSLSGEMSFIKCIHCAQLSDTRFCLITGGKELVVWNFYNYDQQNNGYTETNGKFQILHQKIDVVKENDPNNFNILKSYFSNKQKSNWWSYKCLIM